MDNIILIYMLKDDYKEPLSFAKFYNDIDYKIKK